MSLVSVGAGTFNEMITHMPFEATANLCKVAPDDPFIHVRYRAKDYHHPVRALVVHLLGLAQSTWLSVKPPKQ